jgi:hypothetical protein
MTHIDVADDERRLIVSKLGFLTASVRRPEPLGVGSVETRHDQTDWASVPVGQHVAVDPRCQQHVIV